MRHLFLSTMLLASIIVTAQKGSTPVQAKPDTAATIKHYEKMYSEALDLNDLQAATIAMYSILTYHPNDIGIKDTLARLYFTRGMGVQAVLAGTEVLEAQPDNRAILEVVAVSQENLGLGKESLETYEKLYKLTQSSYYRYQIASLQYKLKRLGECSENLNALLNAEGLDKEKITMNYGQAGSQEVNMKAAVVNMLGVLAMDLGQKESAKQLFEQSLKLEPEFLLAQANLEALKKADEEKGTAPGIDALRP